MIVALVGFIIALLFGGGDMEYYMVTALDKGVETCVVDKSRQKEIKQLLKANKKKAKAFYKKRDKNIDKLKGLLKDQKTEKEAFDTFVSAQFADLYNHQDLVFQTRIDALKLITEDEWECIINKSEKKTTKKNEKAVKNTGTTPFSNVEKAIEKNIIDGIKRSEAMDALTILQDNYVALHQSLKKRNEIDQPIIRNYSSSFDELKTISLEVDELREKAFNDLVNFHQTLGNTANAKEWKAITKQLAKSVKVE